MALTVWHLSDLHLGHKLVSGLRGFDDPLEHNAVVLDNYCKVVKKDDLVFFYGDLTGGSAHSTRLALAEIAKLPGRKRLTPGNHCPISPIHRDAFKWVKEYEPVFEYVSYFMRRKIAGENLLQIHFPKSEDHTEKARYTEYRMTDWPGRRIHGHIHTNDRKLHGDIHVGIDAWNLFPVNEEQIIELLNDPRENIKDTDG